MTAVVAREVDPEAIILFGSHATGDARPDQVDVRGIEVLDVTEEELIALDEDAAEMDDVIDDELGTDV